MVGDLERLTPLASILVDRARADGVALIWRAQARAVHHVLVREGRTEDSGISTISGHGIQVVTDQGHTALASRDDFKPDSALDLFARVARTAKGARRLGLQSTALPALEPCRGRGVPAGIDEFERIELDDVARRLRDLERRIDGETPGTRLRLAFSADLDAWRVLRDDGTDVLFAMPRCVLRMAAASRSDGGPTHTVGAAVIAPGPDLLWEDDRLATFLARARQATRLARELPDAPRHPAGSFPLVVDYALAKGLAHEAFGHAAEADGFRSSVLARDGVFRGGEQVGARHVSVVDEPVDGDYAWQPFSANGLERRRAVIVDHGRLRDGLSDPWSAERGGVRLTGAARSESFRGAPLPRMSNIRIEVDDPLPAPGTFEDYGPEQVRDLLAAAGVLRRHPRIVYLSGYAGGQVNTALGEFVFNCKAIYELSRDTIRMYKPAIFSGSMFGALGAIREAFGPLLLDALGTCGKWGQRVPSSGGSHYFLVLEPHDDVRLGGQ